MIAQLDKRGTWLLELSHSGKDNVFSVDSAKGPLEVARFSKIEEETAEGKTRYFLELRPGYQCFWKVVGTATD